MRKAARKKITDALSLIKKSVETVMAKKCEQEKITKMLCECYDITQIIEYALTDGLSQERFNFYNDGITEIKRLLELINVQPTNEEHVDEEVENLIVTIQNLIAELNQEVEVKQEIVFLPYKASMWDSMESVWIAAKEDASCNVHVVPIPYYDRNPDFSFGYDHYEGDKFPEYVLVEHYTEYNISKQCPDVIYIHNPYDGNNYVTSVDPRFYSNELKKWTECLVYIPYYIASGHIGEGQKYLPVYQNADYIVTQSEKYRCFFDPVIPENKFLPFGSPKLDKVIGMCKNPPEPPVAWKEKLEGKKVYFYNTTIAEMLEHTEEFLEKLQYVFCMFENNKTSCLLWRPHPLLESTMDSMRPQFKQKYLEIKKEYLENEIGIYDDTPDVTASIALSDAYIGDASSSVSGDFSAVGKPVFIVDTLINRLPEEDDWKGNIIRSFCPGADNRWQVVQNNKLYYAEDFNYKYICELPVSVFYWQDYMALTVKDRTYICHLKDAVILVIKDFHLEKVIELKNRGGKETVFLGAITCDKYIFMIPYNYSYIVRFNTETEECTYISDGCQLFGNGNLTNFGGYSVYNNRLYIAFTNTNVVLEFDAKNLQKKMYRLDIEGFNGCYRMETVGDEIWLLPYKGYNVVCWNPCKASYKSYICLPKEMAVTDEEEIYRNAKYPFSSMAFSNDYIFLTPNIGGTLYVKVDKKTGEAVQWKPGFEDMQQNTSGYKEYYRRSCFLNKSKENIYQMFFAPTREIYEVNLETEEYAVISVDFDTETLRENEPGFFENVYYGKYCCCENAFNTLKNFLENDIIGNPFDKEKQIKFFEGISNNLDGSVGRKIHERINS